MTCSTKSVQDRIKERVYNFSAGPAVLPLPVLIEAQEQMLNYEGCGMSVMEMSHRSKEFEAIIAKAEAGFRKNFGVPDDYAVLFLQGGASFQFAMIPMNFYVEGKPVDVIHTGMWSKKAMGEIKKIGEYKLAASTENENFKRLPRKDELRFNPDASYVHLVSNNTIAGTQWKEFPQTPQGVPVVADMSSDILSRPVDVSKFDLIFAGAQKNIGPAGVAVVAIRKEFAEKGKKALPVFLQYREHIAANSLYNTAPTFSIYIVSLVMAWIEKEGGVTALAGRNEQKAALLYQAIDSSPFFYCPVEKQDRSLMNVVFRVQGNREDLEKKFAEESEKEGLSGLKGHRLVGGLRASIYNAFPVEGVQALIDFMKAFEKKYG